MKRKTHEIKKSPQINIRPGVNILSVLRHVNYKSWFALAEFIDNSIESYKEYKSELTNREEQYKLRVQIEIDPIDNDSITIRDNAAGIHEKDYGRAFKAAEPPPNKNGLSEFGMGMKSASCWFSPKWKVRTTALGEDVEKEVSFDIVKITQDSLEELDISIEPTKKEYHFTEIILSDLYKVPKGKTLNKIKEHLTDIYRVFIRKGELELLFNNEILSYTEPPVLVAPYYKKPESESVAWKKDIDLDFGEDLHASGFVALREKASTSKAGLALFRRDRLIQGSGDEGFRPERIFGKPNSFEYQRIFGDIFLEGFDVSHTKDGFNWGESTEAFLDLLREELMKEDLPLIQQAKGYRAKLNLEKAQEKMDRATDNTAKSIEKEVPPVIPQIDNRKDIEKLPEKLKKIRPVSYRTVDLEYRDQLWQVLIELSMDPAVGNWVEISDIPFPSDIKEREGAKKTSLRLSLNHPFTEKFAGVDASEIEPLLRVAVALGLAEIIARSSGVKYAGTIRKNFNEIIKALSK